MTINQSFVEEMLAYLKEHFSDQMFLACEAINYKRRIPYLVSELSPERLAEAGAVFSGALSFALADGSKDEQSFVRYHFTRDNPANWDDRADHSLESLVAEMRQDGPIFTGFIEKNALRKPFILLDIDLKDNFMHMSKKGVLPVHVTAENLESYLLELSNEARQELAQHAVDLEEIKEILAPNVIIFSGGGLHLWHTLPVNLPMNPNYHRELFDALVARYNAHYPDLQFDVKCRVANKFLRIPGYYNLKYKPKATVELLYRGDLTAVTLTTGEVIAALPSPSTFDVQDSWSGTGDNKNKISNPSIFDGGQCRCLLRPYREDAV